MWLLLNLSLPRFERRSHTSVGPDDRPFTMDIIIATPARWERSREAREERDYWKTTKIGPRVMAVCVRDGFDGEPVPQFGTDEPGDRDAIGEG